MTPFYKLSGAGNDFIALVETADPSAAEIRAWCRRALSLGADGVFSIARADGNGSGKVVRMSYWNRDGRRGRLCLNGSRCAARLAFDLGWADDDLELLTDAGRISAHRLDVDNVAMIMPAPASPARQRTLEVEGTAYPGWHVRVGVPHFVLLWGESLRDLPIAELGPRLRRHPDLAPAGANVDFVRPAGRHRIDLRTYERGVEGETLACGTGVVAAAAAGIAAGVLELPVEARVAGGFALQVDGTVDGDRLATVSLAGDARIVARGQLLPGAGAAPDPVVWS